MKRHNMDISFYLLGILILFKPNFATEDDSFFTAFSNNCSYLKNFSEQELQLIGNNLAECKNWTSITAMTSAQKFSSGTENLTRCYIYYESFVSLCNHSSLKDFKEIVLANVNTEKTVEEVCSNLSILPKENENLHKLIENEQLCKYLCGVYEAGNFILRRLCEQSYYLNNPNPLNTIDINSENRVSVTTSFVDELKETNKTSVLKKMNQNSETQTQVDKIREDNSTEIKKNFSKVIGTSITSKANKQPDTPEEPSQQEVKIDDNIEPVVNKKIDADEEINTEPKKDNLGNGVIQTDESAEDQLGRQPISDNERLVNIDITNQKNLEDLELEERIEDIKPDNPKQEKTDEESVPDRFKRPKTDHQGEPYDFDADMDGNSNFFAYFSFICVIFVIGYVGYHNKQKVLALLLEGRSSRRPNRGRRPNSANYHKLDSNLEEAISSSCRKNSNNVIY